MKRIVNIEITHRKDANVSTRIANTLERTGFRINQIDTKKGTLNNSKIIIEAQTGDDSTFNQEALVKLHEKILKIRGLVAVESNLFSHQSSLRSDKQ